MMRRNRQSLAECRYSGDSLVGVSLNRLVSTKLAASDEVR